MTKITTGQVDCVGTELTFQDRMKAQCRQIEEYRLMVLRQEGRRLSKDEAALEWIATFAEDFARDTGIA